jgi:hypothetical protein
VCDGAQCARACAGNACRVEHGSRVCAPASTGPCAARAPATKQHATAARQARLAPALGWHGPLLAPPPRGVCRRACCVTAWRVSASLLRHTCRAQIIVTHDQEEAFDLADKVVIFNRGVIEQVGLLARLAASTRVRRGVCGVACGAWRVALVDMRTSSCGALVRRTVAACSAATMATTHDTHTHTHTHTRARTHVRTHAHTHARTHTHTHTHTHLSRLAPPPRSSGVQPRPL